MHSTGPLAHRHLVHIRPARGQGSSARIHVRIGGCIRDLQKISWCTVHANGNIHLSSPLDVWLRIYWLIDSALPNIQQQPLFHIIVILQVGFTSWRFDGIHLNMIRCRLLRRWKPACKKLGQTMITIDCNMFIHESKYTKEKSAITNYMISLGQS